MAEDVKKLLEQLKTANPQKSRPGSWYNQDGDCLFCFSEDLDYYADRIDDNLTLYRAENDNHVIGVQVNDITRILKNARM